RGSAPEARRAPGLRHLQPASRRERGHRRSVPRRASRIPRGPGEGGAPAPRRRGSRDRKIPAPLSASRRDRRILRRGAGAREVKLAAFAFTLFSCLAHARESAQVEVAFTPGDDIEGLIVREIARARATIPVQAYLFTDRR